jgi:hypothetical protein
LSSYTDIAPGGTNAAAEAKTCTGAAVTDTRYGLGYLNDPRTSKSVAHALFVISLHQVNNEPYDALASDDTSAVGGTNALPCNYNYSTWVSSTNAVNAAIKQPMLINALNAWVVGGTPVTQVQTTQPSNVLGGQCELCYANDAGAVIGKNWVNQENAEIAVVHSHKLFWDYARNMTTASSAYKLRTYVLASFLLTYDPTYAMLQVGFATPSKFPIMPEMQLVPLNPTTYSSSVTGYQRSGGVYWREYANCYYKGSFVGKCAVAVNPSSTSVALPANSYRHSLTVSGSDVYDGGTATMSGPQLSSLGAASGAILFP